MNLTNDSIENRVLLLVGPTAVGKTELSLRIAEILKAEIVSADSRQVYRYMDIGTAKPSQQELARVPHYFIDIRNPDQYYSAGEYGREARLCVARLLRSHIQPVVVGGSGFYVRALVDGLFAPQISDPDIKEKWRQKIRREGKLAVFAYLRQVDPVTADRLHPNDVQRIVRALEVYELSGRPISQFQKGREEPANFTPVFVGLYRERERLYQRIDARVDRMIASGLVEEVRSLQERGCGPELNALRTVGYREVFDYFQGRLSFEDMVDKIKMNSRRYAKRQMTWFRKDERIRWIDMDRTPNDEIVEQVIEIFFGKGSGGG